MAHDAASSGGSEPEQAPTGWPDHGSPDAGMVEVVVTLETCFLRIYHARMRSLPIVNPNISVRAVGFRPWRDYWFGALITPWFINLVLLPRVKRTDANSVGTPCTFSFPGGDFIFLGAHETELGDYLSCSLLSPLTEIENQLQAESITHGAVQAIFTEISEGQAANSNAAGKHNTSTAQLMSDNGNDLSNHCVTAVTRRGFIKHMAGGFTTDRRRDKVIP